MVDRETASLDAQGISRRGFIGAAAAGVAGLVAGELLGNTPRSYAADAASASGSASGSANSSGSASASGSASGSASALGSASGSASASASKASGSAKASASGDYAGEADVIVCGGGGSGLTAAFSALEQGASVIVLEKADACGGTTALAEGAVQAAGTKWQKELTSYQDDTPDNHFNFWMTDGEGLVEEDLVRTMADNAPDNLQWMADNFNITYSKVFGALPTPYMPEEYMADRIHLIADATDTTKTGGVVWTTNAQKAVTDAGGQIITGTAVTSLILDEDGGVIGVTTQNGDSYKADKGVVLAMAGIEHNEDLAKRYNPQHYWDLKTQNVVTAATDTGDGITMGLAAGADIGRFGGCVDLILATWSGTNNTRPEMPAIFVNMRGNRFVREDTTYAFHMRACYNAAMQEGGWDGCTWMVLDQHMTQMDDQSPWSDLIDGGADKRESDIADGTLLTADTLEDLADQMGVPADNLAFTVQKWNDDCAAGSDTLFGRAKQVVALDTPPYFAYKIVATNIGAIGGLKINTDAAVINKTGDVIPHLFAAGANSSGWLGPYYPGSGTCLQGALNWGRIAGASAANA